MIDFTFTDPACLGLMTHRHPDVIAVGGLMRGQAHAQGLMIDDEIIAVNGVSVVALPRGRGTTPLNIRPLDLRVRRKAIPEG
jgi:hypothetical protein